MPKIGLGRGLDALIPLRSNPQGQSYDLPEATRASGVLEVNVSDLRANPNQPRARFEEHSLNELAESVREHGVIQPIIVIRSNEPGATPFTIVAGERRWRAARQAGLKKVPVIVKEASPQQVMEMALIENIQRADLSPLEEALAFQVLATEYSLTHEAVARRVGKSRVAVSNTLRLLELPEKIQAMVLDGVLTEGHARCVLQVKSAVDQLVLAEEIVNKGLSVRQAEELARRISSAAVVAAPAAQPSAAVKPDRELRRIEDQLRGVLGTKVSVSKSRNGGKILLDFYSDEEFKALVNKLLSARG